MTSGSKLILGLVLVSINLMNCMAQIKPVLTTPNRSNSASTQNYVGTGVSLTSEDSAYPIDGTPYFNEYYLKGMVYSYRGSYADLLMRYNIFLDRVEFRNKDSVVYTIIPDKVIKKVVIDNNTLVVDTYELKGDLVSTFFMRQDSGKLILLTKMMVSFREREMGKPIVGDVPAKYTRMPDVHYIKSGDGPLVKIQNIKKLIEGLPDHQKEMEEFAKKEKTSSNKAKELTSFIKYYNSLP